MLAHDVQFWSSTCEIPLLRTPYANMPSIHAAYEIGLDVACLTKLLVHYPKVSSHFLATCEHMFLADTREVQRSAVYCDITSSFLHNHPVFLECSGLLSSPHPIAASFNPLMFKDRSAATHFQAVLARCGLLALPTSFFPFMRRTTPSKGFDVPMLTYI